MNNKSTDWIVYILKCSDNTFYTGVTNDLQKRVEQHNSGKGAKYTRSRIPVKVVYRENVPGKGQALKREHMIKQLRRSEKISLIEAE